MNTMKQFMQKIRWQRTLVVVGAMAGLASLSFNCAPTLMKSSDYSYLNRNSSSGLDLFDAPKDSPWVLQNTFQVYSTMANVTGAYLGNSTAQRTEYDLRTGALAQGDKITDINAPLQMAASSMAGVFCSDLVTRESTVGAVRKFFEGVNFNANLAANSTASYASAIEVMAQSFYGRSLSQEEFNILTAYYNNFVATAGTANTQTRNLYVSTCAGMLASFDAITF